MSRSAPKLCRLCLRDEELVNVFDKRLDNGYQLRLCVFLCTGVEIRMTDKIPKVICHNCSSLAIELYKFRQISLANDKTLKDLANQPYDPVPADKDGLQLLQDSISQRISAAKLSEAATEFLEKENDGEPIEKFQYFPDVSVPEEILTENAESIEDEESEYSSDSDDEDAPIATLKRKYKAAKRANVNKESGTPPYFSSDSNSDPEPIYKRNKRSKYYIDEDYSGGESDEDAEAEWRRSRSRRRAEREESRRERLRPQRMKQQSQEAEPSPEKPIEKQSPEQKYASEPYSKYCDYCDRYFWGNSQLKAHQRVHFRCQFCVKGFETPEILQEHLINVCYKTITRRKPTIPLVRADQDVKLLETYKAAFDEYFADIAAGIYGDPELIKNPSVKYHLYHTESHRISEKKDLEGIFNSFQHLDNTPVSKNASVQTKRLQTDVAYTNSNLIILDDARKDMRLFNIPIHLVIDRLQSAYISFVKPPKPEKVMDLWPADNLIDVSDKSKIGSFHSDEAVLPEQRKAPIIKNVMSMAPRIPMNMGPRRPLHPLGKKAGFEPRTRQLGPRGVMPNVRMNNQGKVVGVTRPGQNMIRKPFRPPMNCPRAPNPTGKVLYRSPNPNINVSGMKNIQNNMGSFNQFNHANNNLPNVQNNIGGFNAPKNSNISILNSRLLQNNAGLDTKSINDAVPYSKVAASNKVGSPQTASPQAASNSATSEIILNNTMDAIIKNVSGSITIQISKQNPKPQAISSESQTMLNISNSVTLEKPKQSNPAVQNNLNVSYPPRPNTAIRNMLESISSEISIEPNYQRQNQNTTSNISNASNRNDNMVGMAGNINSPNTISNTTGMNNITFATPTSAPYKPNRITYPRPILIKEELPREDDVYSNQNVAEQTLYNMDYPVKEEDPPETQTYIKPEVTEDNSYSSNLYQHQSQVNFNAGYPQETPIQYNHQQQYYRPVNRATNLPTVRHRFAVTQPYRMEYRPNNPLNMYQTRLNQPISTMPSSTISSNALVPTNSYSPNNFQIPNDTYNRPYGDNYNSYNNLYQPSFQNQYTPTYNAQTQPAIDYNNTYSDSAPQESESKFLRIKQPWELFR